MPRRTSRDDERAMSEATGVAILVGMTVMVTGVVGLSVVVDQETGPPEATFSFEHISQNNVLLVTHQRGDPIPAGKLVLTRRATEVTWAEVAAMNESELVDEGSTIQLSDRNAFGDEVSRTDTVVIFYDDGGNRTRLDQWD